MSSSVLPIVELLVTNNFASLAMITAVSYDYLLNFRREIHYIWCRPWTWVSTLYVAVRYLGLTVTIINCLNGGTFVPGPARLYPEGTILFLVGNWAYPIFLLAADWVMILRVCALWSRSKIIFGVFFLIYAIQLITSIVFGAISYGNPDRVTASVAQVASFVFCNVGDSLPNWQNLFIQLPRFVLGALLLLLAAVQTLKQSVSMYKATKLWQPNRYVQLLIRDGILYFFMNVLFNIAQWVNNSGDISSTSILFLTMFAGIAIFTLMPRFIIDVRELYERDLRGRWQGVDTGFGLFSQSTSSQHGAISDIAFADVVPGQGPSGEEVGDKSEGIQLEGREGDVCHV